MTSSVVAVLPRTVQPHLADRLPAWLQPQWYEKGVHAVALAPQAEVLWMDHYRRPETGTALRAASRLRWFTTALAGVDGLPMAELQARGVTVTNGAGLNAVTIAEYVLMGMLTIAKGYRQVVQAQGTHTWLRNAPGQMELAGTRALVIGFGGIGRQVAQRLRGCDVEVVAVRRRPDPDGGTLGPDAWRTRLGEFDWVVLALPDTPETTRCIGAAELAAMKPGAVLLNVARGSLIDQDALASALHSRHLGAAFLDVTEPEPLPPEHPLWSQENCHITMHLSGRSQTRMFERAAERFLDNLARFREGRPLLCAVDPVLGY